MTKPNEFAAVPTGKSVDKLISWEPAPLTSYISIRQFPVVTPLPVTWAL
jgi:hypothetical protein